MEPNNAEDPRPVARYELNSARWVSDNCAMVVRGNCLWVLSVSVTAAGGDDEDAKVRAASVCEERRARRRLAPGVNNLPLDINMIFLVRADVGR